MRSMATKLGWAKAAAMAVAVAIAVPVVLSACTSKSDEQKVIDQLQDIAKSGDAKQAAAIYDVDVRLQAAIIASILATPPASQPDVATADLPKLKDPAATASMETAVANELLKGALGDDLRAGGCEWATDVTPVESAALTLPDIKHGMSVQVHNAIVDMQNLIGHTEVGHIKCPSGHAYPFEIVQRRDEGSPWKVLRIGLPPKG